MSDIKNEDFKIKVSDLLIKLSKINNAINIKRKYLYENEIINIKNELNISYENANDIVETVYKESFDNIYKDVVELINSLSHNLVDNYDLEDFYTLNKKEYSLIFQSNI